MAIFITPGGAGTPGTPGGSDTQIQFNDGGAFAGDDGLVFNKTTNTLTTKGDINLDDGGSFQTTLQLVTPTANRTITFPNATGTVGLVAGSSGQVVYNNAGAYAGVSMMTFDGTSVTLAGRLINSYTSLASSPAKVFTGTWFTGGTSTTTKPHFLIEPTGTTSTAWSTNGTGLGVNAASGFDGNLLDLQVNGTSRFKVEASNTRVLANGYYLDTTIGYYLQDGVNGILNGSGFKGILTSSLSWVNSANANSGTIDLALFRDAANTLAQRNGTNAQTFRLYNTFTDASNYERHTHSWSGNVLNIANEAAGTGTLRGIAFSQNGAASTPPATFTGTWFTGGTSTTTKPQVLIEPTGTTSTNWNTNGTGLGVNAAGGFTGNLLDLQVNGTRQFSVNTAGLLELAGSTVSGGISYGNNNYGLQNAFEWTFKNPNGWIGFAAYNAAADVKLSRDAANTLAQRNGTNAQKTNIYDTFTSSTDYHRVTIATARATLSNVSGASVTATGLIPAGAVVMGVTSKVTTALGTANGTTGYKIGTGADDDRWGAITGTTAGTTSDNRNWTAGTIECFPAATDVIVTATGGNFNGTGVIYLSVQYMAGEAD